MTQHSRAANPGNPAADPSPRSGGAADAEWGSVIPDDQWQMFVSGIDALGRAKVEFVLHGALGLAAYTGRFRNTKDVDVIVRPADKKRAVEALRGAGFADYFEREAYDRSWIFRGYKGDGIFDVIWDLPNHRVNIEESWFERCRPLRLRGRELKVAPAENIIRAKIYVMQRGRCDWPDLLNLLAATVEKIDWRWLVARMGPDLPLLQAVLAAFNWMCPERARRIPEWLRRQFALADFSPDDPDATEERRVPLFESRPWFALHQPVDRALER